MALTAWFVQLVKKTQMVIILLVSFQRLVGFRWIRTRNNSCKCLHVTVICKPYIYFMYKIQLYYTVHLLFYIIFSNIQIYIEVSKYLKIYPIQLCYGIITGKSLRISVGGNVGFLINLWFDLKTSASSSEVRP